MRFDTVNLLRYGHFSGRQLDFPRVQGPDFHLILGRNEAGKSTLRQAFHDLLFGIPMDTPMSFLHPGTELELAARLSGGSRELAFMRRRKRNGGLVDAHGEPLPADALRDWLGEVNEAFYERMFGLDHRRLEHGGRSMLQAGDNVDSVLFQAAAGVSALNEVLAALGEEAAGLWAPRRSRDRAWYVAAGRLAEADAVLKSATIRPSAWADAHRESKRLDDAYTQAEQEHADLLARVRELERLRRMAPLLAQVRQIESAQEAHGAQSAAGPYKEYEPEIIALEEQRLRVADHRSHVQRCASHIEVLWGQLTQALRQLGRPAPQLDTEGLERLAAQLPPRPLRREIEQLLSDGRQLRAQAEAATQALAERRAELARLQNEMAALPAVSVSAPLRRAVHALTAAGDIESRVEAAHRQATIEKASLRRRLAAIVQPGVECPNSDATAVEWLAAMSPWPANVLAEHAQRRQHLESEIDSLGKRVREAQLEHAAAALELEQFLRAHQAVSRDEVVAARRERDALWRDISEGKAALTDHATGFAALVLNADAMADRHLEAVSHAARLQALQHEHERRERGSEALGAAQAWAVQQLAEYDAQWALECQGRRLPVIPPSALQAWLIERESALGAHERWHAAATEVETLESRRQELHSTLLDALMAEAQAVADGGQSLSLEAAQQHAESLLQRAQAAQARREALAEQVSRVEALLPALEEQCAQRNIQETHWGRMWHDALERAGLPHTSQSAYVQEAITLLGDADELASQLREAYAERDRMAGELQAFERAAQHLAGALNDASFALEESAAHVRRWMTGVEHMRVRERSREEAQRRLAELNQLLLAEGEGRSRAEIEAELAAVDVSQFAAQSEALATALKGAAANRSELAVQCEQARNALEAISGGDAAAQAAARRQEALADMAEVAERYVRLHAEQRLLEWVTERYRDRRQGPLLARAGQVFSDLTLNAHSGLVVDTEVATLHARRADGALVPLEGLSDGTRDQLYLALRLAALELYLDHAPPMPFIADDLFVNYDDQRAVAGLRNLGRLAGRTQVIFLTHHTHMAELGREALGQAMQLIEL